MGSTHEAHGVGFSNEERPPSDLEKNRRAKDVRWTIFTESRSDQVILVVVLGWVLVIFLVILRNHHSYVGLMRALDQNRDVWNMTSSHLLACCSEETDNFTMHVVVSEDDPPLSPMYPREEDS